MKPQPRERIIGIGGPTGFGKSSLARRLLRADDRLLVLEAHDKKSDYPGLLRYDRWDELFADMRDVRPRTFRVAFAPGLTFFPHVCRLAWLLAPVRLVIEEAGKYFGPGIYYPERDAAGKVRRVAVPRVFVDLIERGRHAGPRECAAVSLVAISQRPVRIPASLRFELARFYAFRLADRENRAWLAGMPGCDSATAERTKDLPRFEFLNICADGGVSCETTSPQD